MGDDPVSTATAGPYESTSAYADGEFFDTTGTAPGFCADCEHAPCVGGTMRSCMWRPRAIVVGRLRNEVFELLDPLYANPLMVPLRMAAYGLSDQARANHGGIVAEMNSADALRDLVSLRDDLRKLAP